MDKGCETDIDLVNALVSGIDNELVTEQKWEVQNGHNGLPTS